MIPDSMNDLFEATRDLILAAPKSQDIVRLLFYAALL